MERRGPLLLWEEGISVCRSQVGPFVVTFRRLLSGLASTHANEHTSTKLRKSFVDAMQEILDRQPLLKEKWKVQSRPQVDHSL